MSFNYFNGSKMSTNFFFVCCSRKINTFLPHKHDKAKIPKKIMAIIVCFLNDETHLPVYYYRCLLKLCLNFYHSKVVRNWLRIGTYIINGIR